MDTIKRIAFFLLVCVIAVLMLPGCSMPGMSAVMKTGGHVNDLALDSSIIGVCSGTSAGAVDRRFDTPEKREARAAFCEAAEVAP